MCIAAFGVYRWNASRGFDRLLRELVRALAEQEAGHGSDEDERARIGLLAEDIAEMRPFLVRNFPLVKAIVTLPGGLVAGFRWDTLDRIGMLQCASTERELLEQYEKGVGDRSFSIGYDGLLRCPVNWFRDLSTIREPLPFPALAVGRVVLELVHARLYGFFDKIDLEAVCASWRGRVTGAEAEQLALFEGERDGVLSRGRATRVRLEAQEQPARASDRHPAHAAEARDPGTRVARRDARVAANGRAQIVAEAPRA